jgi:hypothetical protein
MISLLVLISGNLLPKWMMHQHDPSLLIHLPRKRKKRRRKKSLKRKRKRRKVRRRRRRRRRKRKRNQKSRLLHSPYSHPKLFRPKFHLHLRVLLQLSHPRLKSV